MMPPMRPYISSRGGIVQPQNNPKQDFNLTQQTKTFKHFSQVPCPSSLFTDSILRSKMLFPFKVHINTSEIKSSLETFAIDQNHSLTLVCKHPKSHQVISTCRDLVIQIRQLTQSQNQSFKVALFFLRIRWILPQFPSHFPLPHFTFRNWYRSRQAAPSATVRSFVGLQGTAAFSDREAPCGSVTGAYIDQR